MPPGAGYYVGGAFNRARYRPCGLGGLRGPRHNLSALAREFPPTIVKVHVIANLDAQLPKITRENRYFFARSGPMFQCVGLGIHHKVDLAIDTGDLALSSEQNGGVAA